ncbi:TonB-dependent receptor-like protein [Winogradskyella wandonensis]|uniref:TonB-dependent receptor-like protein n=1 Tax=Winogradskyella wandonensis TaxID=1442586 RepID=A0A4R1KS95_9FLAO|nr:TonB-dependent receptor [Winogradskyella wandonensis]TCK67926.1 TonB-dependent receptor-like protein [Winogradskyella wandonensis]
MGKTKYYILICLSVCLLSKLQGQNLEQKVSISKILDEISKIHSISFNYETSLLENLKIKPPPETLSLSAKIKNLENQTGFVFEQISPMVYSISKPLKLCGYIKDSELQTPLTGATIKSKYAYAITDENGYFEIALKSKNELLTIRHLGFKTIERQVKFFNLKECFTISMFIQQELIAPVLIETYIVKGIDKRKDWTTSIDYNRFSLLPGLIESDVLQTVQALPSILSVDETVSNINIRGGSNDQNLMLWDDIKMYQTGHFFGLISSFNPLMTQTASVINNGSDVSLTDGVSGTIHMQTNKQIDSKFSTTVGLNFLNAELFSNIPIGNKSSLQVASRKSLDDIVRTPTYNVYFDRVTQDTEAESNMLNVTNSNQEFDFYDASLRWLYQPTDNDLIRLNFIVINNNLGFNETATINGAPQSRRSNVSQNSLAVGLNYQRQWNKRLSTTLNVYNTEYKLEALNADVLNNQLQLQENIVSESSILLNNMYKRNRWQFNLGYQFTETEVINLNDIDLPRFVRRDEEILREHSAFGQAWYKNRSNDFSVRGGVRANYLSKFQKLIIEPRLSVRQSLGDNIEIEAQGEFKHQSTSQIVNFQNDFLGVEKRRWQLTDNDSIPVLQSKQVSLGITYKNSGWLLDAIGYFKKVDGITTQSQSFTTKYEFAKEKGNYDAFGLEFLCRKSFGNFNSWLSYSYINNTYTFEALEDRIFPSNFDITHSITLGTTFSNKSWNISAGVNYRVGKPTSVPLDGNEIVDDAINFDIANNERLLDYLRIDASALYKFKISNALRSEVGASVWNISDRENAINNYYRINNNDVVDKFSRFSLGLTTNAVVRVYF